MWKESLRHQRESLGDCVSEARGMKRLAQKLLIGVLMRRKEGLEKLQLRWNSGSFEENCELIFSKFCMKPPLELIFFFSFSLEKERGKRWWIECLLNSHQRRPPYDTQVYEMLVLMFVFFSFSGFSIDFTLNFWSCWLESLKGWCFWRKG